MRTIITITGKTCSGKSTLESKLVKEGYNKIVSTTSRSPRNGELDGIDYHFVSKSRFETMLTDGDLIESVNFNGNYYGVDSSKVTKSDTVTVIVCEVEGVHQVHKYCKDRDWIHYAIFVDVDPETQARRFLERDIMNSTNLDIAVKRLSAMLGIEQSWRADFDYDLIIEYNNHTQDKVIEDIRNKFG